MTQLQNKRWFSYFECEVLCWVYWNKQGEGSALSLCIVVSTNLKINIRQLSSSTEAEVDIILPRIRNDLISLITREGMSSHVCCSIPTHGHCLYNLFL